MAISTELIAILCGIALSIASSLIFVVVLKRVRVEIYEFGNEIMEGFMEIFANPAMKTTMSMIGQKGGEAKAEAGLVDKMANDMLDSPQFAAIKMGAQTLGFDLDEYIETHGAVKTLAAAKQLGAAVGIDIMNIDLASLAGGAIGGQRGSSGGGNAYLGGR